MILQIYVCLTPPTTLYKVEKHITECQNEVKSNIFHEAFSLIHDTAFHHPHEHATIEYKDHKDEHDDFAHHNFTLTEKDILKFFENHDHHHHHDHIVHDDLHTHPHPHPHHYSIDEHASDELEHSQPYHTHTEHSHHPIVHWPQPHSANIHKKTDIDAVQQQRTGRLIDNEQRLLNTITAKHNPYTYFDIKSGTTAENQEQLPLRRSDVHARDIHSDVNHHHSDIHPTTASFKDKRIAGVSIDQYNEC